MGIITSNIVVESVVLVQNCVKIHLGFKLHKVLLVQKECVNMSVFT